MKTKTFFLLAGLMTGGFVVDAAAAEVKPTNAPVVRPARADRVDYWGTRLNLSPEQKDKLRPLLNEETEKFAELRKQTNLKPEERRAKYMAIREETNAKIKPILTPEQWAKYSQPYMAATNAAMRRLTNTAPVRPAAPAAPAAPAK
jgi:Spy/CpxP family protein refolding chaperone